MMLTLGTVITVITVNVFPQSGRKPVLGMIAVAILMERCVHTHCDKIPRAKRALLLRETTIHLKT
jgi:hypothetical protein